MHHSGVSCKFSPSILEQTDMAQTSDKMVLKSQRFLGLRLNINELVDLVYDFKVTKRVGT